MRTFLANFIYTSGGQSYNADSILFKQKTFPTSYEVYQHIKSAVIEKGLQVHGSILWTGIIELNKSDEQEFVFKEE